jgi:hypothetical protein
MEAYEFICPITMETMVHPIATRYGQNFERSAIVKWLFEGSGECSCCPLTRKPLNLCDLIHNHKLAAKIQNWHEINGISRGSISRRSDIRENAHENDETRVLILAAAASASFSNSNFTCLGTKISSLDSSVSRNLALTRSQPLVA